MSYVAPDHIRMQFHVKGKDHVLHLRRQRFEKTVDSIDKMVHSGRHTIDQIKAKHAIHIVDVKEAPKTAKKAAVENIKKVIARQRGPAKEGEFDKKAHVVAHIEKHGLTASTSSIAKSAALASDGKLSYANAYYLASKHIKGK